MVRGSYLNTYLWRSKHRFSSPLLYAYPGISPQRRRARSFEVIAQSWNLDSLFSCQGTYPHNVRNERGCFLGSCRKFFSLLIPTGRGRFSRCFQKSFVPPKSSQRESSKCAGSKELFSLHLFPLREAVWGVILKKNFFPQGVDHEKD